LARTRGMQRRVVKRDVKFARPWLKITAAMILRTISAYGVTAADSVSKLRYLSAMEALEKSLRWNCYASFAQGSIPSALSAGAWLESSRIASLKSWAARSFSPFARYARPRLS
jgi:hypothetical protein